MTSCRCRMSMSWDLLARNPDDLRVASDGSPRTIYECDWSVCPLHRGPGYGYSIGDADALRAAAAEYGGVFANILAEAMAEPDPMPESLREYNRRAVERQHVRDWVVSG